MRLHYHFDVPEDKKVRVVVDTDAKNEADDQFAIVQAILTPKFRLEGIVAAHYKAGFAAQYGGAPVKDSMMQSYAEVEKILDLMNVKNEIPHFKGCKVPVGEGWEEAEGVDFIIDRAMAEDSILHLIVLGPLTNVAAALKKEPRIEKKIHVVWIGGGPYPYGENEFNLCNDIEAANFLFASQVPIWQITTQAYKNVRIGLAELEDKIRPCGKIGEYLCDQMIDLNNRTGWLSDWPKGESWPICDIAAVGLMIDEHEYLYENHPAPFITQDMHYIPQPNRRTIRVYESVDTRYIFEDLVAKLRIWYRAEKNSNP